MKNFKEYTGGFEKQVLKAASNIPVDYNPKGWESLSKQLDTELPLNKAKIGTSLKLWLISIGVSTVLGVLLLTNYSSQAMNSTTGTKDTKSKSGVEFQLEQPSSNQGKNVLPPVWNSEDQLTKTGTRSNDAISTGFSTEGLSNGVNGVDLGKKKDEISVTQADSAAVKTQPKQAEKDSLFIFW